MNKPDKFASMVHGIIHRPQAVKLAYLVDWYIGVGRRRGWDEVVRLLKEKPEAEENIKKLIKKRLGK